MSPEAQGEDAKAGVCLGKSLELRLEDDWRHVQPVERDLGFQSADNGSSICVHSLSLRHDGSRNKI